MNMNLWLNALRGVHGVQRSSIPQPTTLSAA